MIQIYVKAQNTQTEFNLLPTSLKVLPHIFSQQNIIKNLLYAYSHTLYTLFFYIVNKGTQQISAVYIIYC
jgi:hypothetical protein